MLTTDVFVPAQRRDLLAIPEHSDRRLDLRDSQEALIGIEFGRSRIDDQRDAPID